MSYLFSDENYNEMFGNADHSEDIKDKKEKDGIATFYASIDIEKKNKIFFIPNLHK